MAAGEATEAPGRAYCLRPGGGEAIWMFDSLDTIKADADQTSGRFTLVEFLDFEGSGPPLHTHSREDRGFYVLEGDYTFYVGDETIPAQAGSWIYAPRGIPHTWRCDSSRGRVLDLIVPGGMEDFYRESGEAVRDTKQLPEKTEPEGARLAETAARYGIAVVGPPPARP